MYHSKYLILLALVLWILPGHAQTISVDEIEFVIGREWRGEMKNYDFKKEKHISVPAVLFVQPSGRRSLKLIYRYPADSDNISQTELEIKKKSTKIGKNTITSKKIDPDGTLTLTTQGNGKIQGNKVRYNYIYRFGPNVFAIKRDIYYIDLDVTVTANDYKFLR